MMMKKYLIHFVRDKKPKEILNWIMVDTPDASLIFAKENNMFKDAEVVLLEASKNDRATVLSAARELMAVAKVVKVVRESDPDKINEKVLDSAPAIPNSLLTMNDDDFAALATLQSAQVLHPAQDYNNGVFYYGAIVNGVDMIVTSNGEMFSFAETVNRDIALMQKDLSASNLRHETVIEYFTGGLKVNADELFKEIRKYVQRHIYFSEPETYDLIAIWIMGTYIYRGFRYYPYIHLNAEKGSGKTLLMELMVPISFNGILLSQPVASTVLKLINQAGATLFIDEAEGLAQKQTGGNNQVKQILKTGFNRSGQFYIGETMYRTYGPKCFAGINDLDDVLADRAITIKILRKTNAEKVELYRETPTMRSDQMKIRDQLYLFGLRFGPIVAQDYEIEKPFYDKLSELTNRAYDVWVPLYRIVTSLTDNDLKASIFNSLDKLSQIDGRRRKMRDAEENETSSLINNLTEVLKQVQPYKQENGLSYYETDGLYNEMVKNEKIPKSMQRKAFSRFIKRVLEIESKPVGFKLATKRMYVIDEAKFEEYKKRYADIV